MVIAQTQSTNEERFLQIASGNRKVSITEKRSAEASRD